jgi:FlaA1/EpsC-like NDP-sugar epimerase
MPVEKQKVACVTGAGGSLGSILTRALVAEGYTVRAVSRSELSMHKLLAGGAEGIEPIIGNILDADTRRRALSGASLVYHTAAHKHVKFCEDNLLEAVRNNVLGTMLLAESALQTDSIEQFILLSTDKAVYPSNVMGMTKRVCELLMHYYMTGVPAAFKVARLCNVRGTSGSVYDIWRRQLNSDQPLTVVKDMWRYFMSPAEAERFLLAVREVSVDMSGLPEVFFPAGLKEASIEELAREFIKGYPNEINFVEPTPGEKQHESMTHSYSPVDFVENGIAVEEDSVPDTFKQGVEQLLTHLIQGEAFAIKVALQKAISSVTIVTSSETH